MIITRTPLRISFLGGGTDYPEYFETHSGAVLGTAVDKSAYFNLSHFYSPMFDYSLRIAYRKVECVNSIEELEHVPFRECLRWTGLTRDIEINHSAELPACTGLGSSSSFVVGLLNTAYAFQRRLVHGLELAYQAVEIERRVLGESVGCQDQTFAAVGGFNLIEFRTLGNFIVHRLALSQQRMQEIQEHLLVFYTGIRRRAEELAVRQVKRVNLNLSRLAAMRRMVDEGYRILTGPGSLAAFGRLLHDSWMAKRSLDGPISSDVIDTIYDTGIAAGAFGGKLLGAGGGGFIAFFVPPERQATVRARLAHLPEVEFRMDAAGSHVIHCEAQAPRSLALPHREAA
jgi:D-glycero-alpha-D-manno-heptose-7-phosphate kinase